MFKNLFIYFADISLENNKRYITNNDDEEYKFMSDGAFEFNVAYRNDLSCRVLRAWFLNNKVVDEVMIDVFIDFIQRFNFAYYVDNPKKINYYEIKVYKALFKFLREYE